MKATKKLRPRGAYLLTNSRHFAVCRARLSRRAQTAIILNASSPSNALYGFLTPYLVDPEMFLSHNNVNGHKKNSQCSLPPKSTFSCPWQPHIGCDEDSPTAKALANHARSPKKQPQPIPVLRRGLWELPHRLGRTGGAGITMHGEPVAQARVIRDYYFPTGVDTIRMAFRREYVRAGAYVILETD